MAKPTCQFLPPNFPGYEPYCPYTLDPGPGGQWTEPDMEEAQRLVRRSGTVGTHVTFWYQPSLDERALAKYFVHLLTELRFEADLRSTPDIFAALRDPSRGVQIAPAGSGCRLPLSLEASSRPWWGATCSDPNYGDFCDKDIDRMIEHAVRIPIDDPDSGQAWAEVDHAITDQAPFVSFVNPIRVDLVSKRLGNYQYNPVSRTVLLAQVWVR